MAKAITIPKDKSSYPQYLDFYNLREIGLQHIQELGGDIWTDHNLHDPGITILEVLCYAITDLGYRTNFDIKDLLARSKQAKKEASKTIFNLPFDDNFYSAAHILSCNPLTVTDYRKLFLDIPGVKNAWLEKSNSQEVRIGINCTKKELFTIPQQADVENPEVKLNGLYDICIEIEPQLVIDACGQTLISRNNIIKRVYEVYHAHRNLCEDVRDICIFGDEDIAICADVELASDADPEEVMLQICLKVEEFLSPTLRFYTLQEMLEKGKSVEEIFEGRPLTSDTANIETGENCLPVMPSRGFIDIDELKKLDPQSELHVSDVHNVIMQIEGVQAIHKLVLVNYINGLPQTKGEEWCVDLSKGYRPHIGISTSKVNFFKGPLYFTYNKDIVVQRFAEEKNAKLKACLEPYQLDLPIPDGTYHDLQDYTSIQHEFPLTYGVGSEGINQPPTQLRKAQAKQLKGYLLFFDQILSNYLAQLSHVRDLFSMRRDDDPAREFSASTYFSQTLKDVPGAEYLIKNLEACQPSCSPDTVPEDYPNYLGYITERKEDYQKRRNHFLDHLLARFSESFTDYVTQMYKLQKEDRDEQFIINSKANLLQNYPEISRNRSKALDILQKPVWDTDNVSGLKKRISALLGITDSSRRTLSKGEIIETAQSFFVQFSACDKVTLQSKELFADETLANMAAEALVPLLYNKNNYQILEYSISNLRGYSYTITDSSGTVIARSLEHFTNAKALSNRVDSVIELFVEKDIVFTYPNQPDRYNFKVTDNDGNELLESAGSYLEKSESEKSQALLKNLAVLKDNYCRVNSEVENASEFGFALVEEKEGHARILMQSNRYSTYDKCQEALYCFINGTALQNTEIKIIREDDCFEYWVYDALSEEIIFKSYKGYKTSDLALHAPDINDIQSGYEKFTQLGIDIDYYHNIVKNNKYSFELHTEKVPENSKGGFELFEGKDSLYYFRLKDANHRIILQSNGFTSLQEAKKGIGSIRKNLTDDSVFGRNVTKEDQHYFVVKAKKGEIIGKSEIYPSKADMENDIESVRKNNFAVKVELAVNIEAYHPFLYDTEQECEDRKWAVKYYVDNEPYQSAVIGGEPGNFILEIKDTKGNTLLVSPPDDAEFNYKTEAAAQRAHQKIRRRASDERKTYYELLDNLEGELPYGFRIKDRDGSIIAQHPQQYASAEERNLAIDVILYGIRNQVASYRHIKEKEGYRFELLSMNHDVLLRSETLYATKHEIEEAWNELLLQASAFSNYVLSEKTTDKKPSRRIEICRDKNKDYYFRIKAANDDKLLQSEGYKTKQGCENGIETLKDHASDETSYERIKTDKNQFYFVIKAKNGKVLGTSEVYTTKANMEKALKSVKNNVNLIETIDTTTLKSSDKPYSFSLLDVSKKILANHTRSYISKQERDLALQSIINYVSYTEFRENISGTAGSYTFILKGKKDDILLESALRYADEPSAVGAFKAMVLLAQKKTSYVLLSKDFRFEIVNEENEVIARPPDSYKFINENERDAAIDLILAYLRDDKVQYAIENVAGAFFSEITDQEYKPLLRGTELSVSKEKAQVKLDKLIGKKESPNISGYTSNPEYYKEYYNKNQICPYGFNILNESGKPVARHPFQFHTKEGLNKAMFNVFSWLTDYTKLQENIIRAHKWQELKNWQDDVLLHIDYDYLMQNGLEAVKQLALEEDNYQTVYKNSNYILLLKDSQDYVVAKHPKYLSGEKVADDKEAEIILFLTVNGGRYEEPAQNKPFVIFNELGVAMLQSTEGYNNEETLVKAFERGADKNNYRLVPEQEAANDEDVSSKMGYSFQLWDGNYHIANHPIFYEEISQRDDALDKLVTSLQTDWLPNRLKAIVNTWYYELSDFSGRVLLSSKNNSEFFTLAEAEDNYDDAMLLALDKANYESVLRYENVDPENKKCFYSFVISNTLEGGSDILFTHGLKYDCIKDRNQVMQEIIDLLKTKQFKSDLKGTTCGYFYNLKYHYTPESEEETKEIIIKSAKYYPSKGETMLAVTKLAELMKSAENYIEPEVDEDALWDIMDENKCLYAAIYSDGEAEAVKQALIDYATNVGVETDIEYSIEESRVDAQYQLKDQDEILLQTESNGNEDDCGGQREVDICEKSDKVAALGQSDKYYRKINSAEYCLHGFELLDNIGSQLAGHNKLYFSKSKADTVIDKTQAMLNSEGLHLVEHLLLRPRQTMLSPQYHFVIQINGEVLLNGIFPEKQEEDTFQFASNNFINIIKSYTTKDSLTIINPDESDKQSWKFQLEIDGSIKGISENTYCSLENLEADKDLVHNKLLELKDALTHEGVTKKEINEILLKIISSTRTTKELKGDEYLPVPLLCNDNNGEICSELSDPYSFRATIVIPFWPKRFNDPQFREFMETTLRRETPAHILPRICWLDTCQMREFETAYQRWLNTQEIKNDHCDALDARNALIEVLKKLRSNYPEAQLFSCAQDSADNNILVLDNTRLG